MISPTTAVSLAALTTCAFVGAANAGTNDYAFEPVQSQVQKGEGVTVAVRLIEKSSKKPIPDAVIIGSRLDMAPDQMPTMVPLCRSCPAMNQASIASKRILSWPVAGDLDLRLRSRASRTL